MHPEILALIRDTPPEMATLPPGVSIRLQRLFRTVQPVVVLAAPVAVLREIALRATVENRALAIVAGPESAALADAVEALGREVIRVMVHPGATLEPEHLARFLVAPAVDSVVLMQTEKGTGALAPVRDYAAVVRAQRDTLLFVDAGAALGADPVETDVWGLDMVLAGSEGPLALPPGLGFAAASPRALSRAARLAGRGVQLDFVTHHAAAARAEAVAPLPLARALARQLELIEGEGLAARWERHRALASQVADWATGRGDVSLLARPDSRAAALSCLRLPPGRSAQRITAGLLTEGWQVATGTDDSLLWVGHMGGLTADGLRAFLAALDRVLDDTTK